MTHLNRTSKLSWWLDISKCAPAVLDCSHVKAMSLLQMPALPWAHAYWPSKVFVRKQFYMETDTVSGDSLTLNPCKPTKHSSYAETILHGDRHGQRWQPYLGPMHTGPAINNFTWRQTWSMMTALPWVHAYRPSNKQFYMETETVDDDSLILGPCIQAKQ